MAQLAFAGGQPAADFAQGLCPSQMAEQHGYELAPARKSASVPFGTVLDDGEDLTSARVIDAANFFQGPLMTALKPDEIITEIRLPTWPAKRRFGFQEFARRRGDFALAAAMLFYDGDGGKVSNAHVGAIGVADRPLRLEFFGETLESIRSFDIRTQRSDTPAGELTIDGRRRQMVPTSTVVDINNENRGLHPIRALPEAVIRLGRAHERECVRSAHR